MDSGSSEGVSESRFKDRHQESHQAKDNGRPPEYLGELGLAVDEDEEKSQDEPDGNLNEDPERPTIVQAGLEAKATNQDKDEANPAGDGAHSTNILVLRADGATNNEASIGEKDHENARDVNDSVQLMHVHGA